jgi:rSAM/selenodomain-associated transferase 1
VNNLIIFTRYPEAGKTKTRLIPLLGKYGAASLQSEMMKHTLVQAKKLQQTTPVRVEVHFAGGNKQLMQNWLGSDIIYRQQQGEDLGERMMTSFQTCFAAKMKSVVIIGSDCPDVNNLTLAEAFTALQNHDLVLGPATDGGYYLIGLNYLIKKLFIGMDWGGSQVLKQTQNIARGLGLKIYFLAELNDIDRPEDLVIWEKYQNNG